MATKKGGQKKASAKKEKSTLIKIAESIGTVVGELSVKSDQISEMASNAVESVKEKIESLSSPKIKKQIKKPLVRWLFFSNKD